MVISSKISFIVPTLNRIHDLTNFFDNLLKLSSFPFEILIIDQSDDGSTKYLCESSLYQKLNIRYYHHTIKSSSLARNFAIDHLHKDVDYVVFLDDDTTLAPDFLEQIELFFIQNPHAKGGVANIKSPLRKISFFKKIGLFLLTWKFVFTEMFVTNGWFNVMPLVQPKSLKHVERTSGCGMFFRKTIFDEKIRFEKRFMKYSLMEDCFLSYSIYRKYPKSLFFVPTVKMIHHETPVARIANKAKIYQNIVHRFYFVKKFNKSIIAYFWTMIIFCFFDILQAKDWRVIMYYVEWLRYVITNRNNIIKSDFDFNKFIFG